MQNLKSLFDVELSNTSILFPWILKKWNWVSFFMFYLFIFNGLRYIFIYRLIIEYQFHSILISLNQLILFISIIEFIFTIPFSFKHNKSNRFCFLDSSKKNFKVSFLLLTLWHNLDISCLKSDICKMHKV